MTQLPRSPSDAKKRWGINGTVSLNVEQLATQLGILVTTEYGYSGRRIDSAPYWGATITRGAEEIHAVRLSGHPDSLLTMFRMLHMEYAKKIRRKKIVKPKRTLILDMKD